MGRLSLGRIRAEKQRHLILAQIENLKEAIPRAQEAAVQRQQNLKEDITQISVLIDNCRAEAELLDNLRSHQVENEFTGEVVREKKEVTEQLFLLQARQREELEALKREKYCEVDLGEVAGEREVAKIVAKVQVLEQELEGLEAEKKRKEARHKETMVDLKAELEKAERQRVISKKEEDEDQFACPVCMELLMPPPRIFLPGRPHPVRELQGKPISGALPPVQNQTGDELQQEQSPGGGGENFLPEGDDKCLVPVTLE